MSASHDPSFDPLRGAPLPPLVPAPGFVRHELHHLRLHWWWFLALGILLAVCGMIAVIVPPLATAVAIDVLAIVFLIAGVATIVNSLWAGNWSGTLVSLLIGVLYIGAWFAITAQPLHATKMLTLFIAMLFLVGGAFRTIAAMSMRFPQWGWAMLNGIVTMVLGLIIFRHYPVSSLWVPGLLVGLEMLFSGWTWIMLALVIRKLPEEPAA